MDEKTKVGTTSTQSQPYLTEYTTTEKHPRSTPVTQTLRRYEYDGSVYRVLAVSIEGTGEVVLSAPDFGWSYGGFGVSVSRSWLIEHLSAYRVGTRTDRLNLATCLVSVFEEHHARRLVKR